MRREAKIWISTICNYTRHDQKPITKKKKKTQGQKTLRAEPPCVRYISNQTRARHGTLSLSLMHATHARKLHLSQKGLRWIRSNTTRIRKILNNSWKTTEVRTSQSGQCHTYNHSPRTTNRSTRVQHQSQQHQAKPGQERKTDRRCIPTFKPSRPTQIFYTITPAAVLPTLFKLSTPASLADHPPASASQTSNLLAPTPRESIPTPKPVK